MALRVRSLVAGVFMLLLLTCVSASQIVSVSKIRTCVAEDTDPVCANASYVTSIQLALNFNSLASPFDLVFKISDYLPYTEEVVVKVTTTPLTWIYDTDFFMAVPWAYFSKSLQTQTIPFAFKYTSPDLSNEPGIQCGGMGALSTADGEPGVKQGVADPTSLGITNQCAGVIEECPTHVKSLQSDYKTSNSSILENCVSGTCQGFGYPASQKFNALKCFEQAQTAFPFSSSLQARTTASLLCTANAVWLYVEMAQAYAQDGTWPEWAFDMLRNNQVMTPTTAKGAVSQLNCASGCGGFGKDRLLSPGMFRSHLIFWIGPLYNVYRIRGSDLGPSPYASYQVNITATLNGRVIQRTGFSSYKGVISYFNIDANGNPTSRAFIYAQLVDVINPSGSQTAPSFDGYLVIPTEYVFVSEIEENPYKNVKSRESYSQPEWIYVNARNRAWFGQSCGQNGMRQDWQNYAASDMTRAANFYIDDFGKKNAISTSQNSRLQCGNGGALNGICAPGFSSNWMGSQSVRQMRNDNFKAKRRTNTLQVPNMPDVWNPDYPNCWIYTNNRKVADPLSVLPKFMVQPVPPPSSSVMTQLIVAGEFVMSIIRAPSGTIEKEYCTTTQGGLLGEMRLKVCNTEDASSNIDGEFTIAAVCPGSGTLSIMPPSVQKLSLGAGQCTSIFFAITAGTSALVGSSNAPCTASLTVVLPPPRPDSILGNITLTCQVNQFELAPAPGLPPMGPYNKTCYTFHVSCRNGLPPWTDAIFALVGTVLALLTLLLLIACCCGCGDLVTPGENTDIELEDAPYAEDFEEQDASDVEGDPADGDAEISESFQRVEDQRNMEFDEGTVITPEATRAFEERQAAKLANEASPMEQALLNVFSKASRKMK